MKILYLAFIRLPTEKAHGVQIMKTCEAFAKSGAEVELLVPGRKTAIAEDPFEYYGAQKNFKLSVVNAPDLVKWGRCGFLFSSLFFSEKSKWMKSFWKADIIFSRDAFVLMQYVFLGRKLIYEAHTKPTLISTFVAKRAYRLVVISEGLRDAYLARGILKEKTVVAHDAIDPEPFKKHYDQKESRKWLGIPQNKKIALYVGRIDIPKGVDTFAAASEFVPEEILCVLIGSGSAKKVLQKKYPKALFLPETPYRELPRVLAAADVLVLPNSGKNETYSKYTSPLKAFAYMAVGKPIVASNVPALRAIFKKNAHYFSEDNPTLLSNALQVEYENPPVSLSYTWDKRAGYILSSIA